MKEIKDILAAYERAIADGKKTALATVVHVEGSSYRRPGARMLVTDDGMLTGAISGGCLEGDALRKALLAITENRNKLVTYDTTDEDDAKFGVQLGCNGIVHILFEPINSQVAINPISLLQLAQEKRSDVLVCTVFSLNQQASQPGTQFLYRDAAFASIKAANPEIRKQLLEDLEYALANKETTFRNIQFDNEEFTAFIEHIPPALALFVFGAGNDVLPLVQIAKILGWEVTVIDGRRTHLNLERFPSATLKLKKAESALEELTFDRQTAAVLMTHNYNYDLEVLAQLSNSSCPYIGVLGPKKKMDRMLDELADVGKKIDESSLAKVYSPVGLDLGAETAEEIALSISAEIKAVLSGKNAQLLRNKEQPIHS
jgi:xanthine dehydrogenase accessory factor